MSKGEITIRAFSTLEEMRACVPLQQSIWQYAELDVVPHHVFVMAQKIGGQTLGAFDGECAVGFVLAFPALSKGEAYLHSHMTAVLPEYQNSGVGRRLKLAQRDDALARGISLIKWTFDPLQLKNAHFNIARLGAIARQCIPNLYGRTSSRLHNGLPTDRLLAEWWLSSDRVKATLQGRMAQPAPKHEEIPVPVDIDQICKSDPDQAESIQRGLRARLQQLFDSSYAITDFRMDQQYGTYLLEAYEDRVH